MTLLNFNWGEIEDGIWQATGYELRRARKVYQSRFTTETRAMSSLRSLYSSASGMSEGILSDNTKQIPDHVDPVTSNKALIYCSCCPSHVPNTLRLYSPS